MYVISDVPKEILNQLEVVIHEKNKIPLNADLAGNIKNEFAIPKGKPFISPFLMQMLVAHKEKYPDYFKKAHSTFDYKEVDIGLFNLWVNFQKKHEFNPVHVHDGLFSFVIWHKVPYTMDAEKANFPNMKEGDIKAGMFAFLFTDPMGRVTQETLPVDKTWEGKIALFPANLNHQVYPFYTYDEYRISISGNLGFQAKKN